MWFRVGPLSLSGFLDVFGRESPHCGGVLMVALELTDMMLTVKLPPHMSVHSVVAELASTEKPATQRMT